MSKEPSIALKAIMPFGETRTKLRYSDTEDETPLIEEAERTEVSLRL